MKKKLFVLLALILTLAMTFTACGGSSGGGKDIEDIATDNMAMDSAPQEAPSVPYATAENGEMGWDTLPTGPAPNPDMPAGDDAGTDIYTGAPENAKIIYTAGLEMETKEFDQAVQSLTETVASMGGYFENRGINQGGRYRSLSCTVRVPVKNFSAFLDKAGEAAHVTYRHEDSEDVSEVYYDNEARLTTQRTKLERLQELLSKAEAMEDIITIESAISDTELQIEYLTGSLRKYDSQINYSTVNIELREVYRLSTDEETPLTFGDRLGSAFTAGFQRGLDGLEDFSISVARNWLSLLIWAVVIAVVILLLRKLSAKRKKTYPTPPLPQKPQEKTQDSESAETGEKK